MENMCLIGPFNILIGFYYYLLPMITLIQRQFRLGPEHGTGLVVLLADHQPHIIPVAHFYRGGEEGDVNLR